jgi:hypothetical protein
MTARIAISDGRLAINRSGVGRWFGPSVDVPLGHVESVAPLDPSEGKRWYNGIRLAGIQVPGLIVSGLFRQGGALSWWDVVRGDEAIAITLRDEPLARLVVGVDDPVSAAQWLQQAADAARASGVPR